MQTNFDSNPPVDVRGVLLDISKVFDKVWHKGLLFKLKSYGVEGDILSLLECYLSNREQRVVFEWSHLWLEKNKFWFTIGVRLSQSTFILDIYK